MTWTSYNPISQMPNHYRMMYDDDTIIPTTDEVAWGVHTEFRRVYNKMHICWTQGIPFGPVGTMPTEYPVCVKPIYNLLGGSVKSQVCHNEQEYFQVKDPSLFWSRYHMGEHYSHDFIMLNGIVKEHFSFRGEKLQHGAFDYWEFNRNYEDGYAEFRYAYTWLEEHLKGYTGCVNVETIGEAIIEVQLRMGDIDRFGDITLMQAIHTLYSKKEWYWTDEYLPKTFYLAALFAQPDTNFTINQKLVGRICEDLTYYQIDNPKDYHCNPSHGNRVAIFCDEEWDKVARARNVVVALMKPDIDGRYVDCLRDYEELRL